MPVAKRLIDAKNAGASGRDHAQHLRLVAVAPLTKRRTHDQVRSTGVLAIGDGRNFPRSLYQVPENGIFMPAVSQFDPYNAPQKLDR